MGDDTKRAESQRKQLANWGHLLHGLCPILAEDCVIVGHNNPTCTKHRHPAEWSVSQATAFRDVILPNVPQVRTGFTRDELRDIKDLVNILIRQKQGLAVSAADLPAPIPERRALSAGQIRLIWDLESLAGGFVGRAPPTPVLPTTTAAKCARQAKLPQAQRQAAAGLHGERSIDASKPGPTQRVDGREPDPGSWSLQQAVSFRTTWPDEPLRVGMSGTQTAFVDALLDAAVMRLSAGPPPPQSSTGGSAEKKTKPASGPSAVPPLRGCSDPEGLCPYMLGCTVPHHTTSHAIPEEWTLKQAVAFRDRIWPVFKQNREGMSDAQVGFVTSLLEVLTGRASPDGRSSQADEPQSANAAATDTARSTAATVSQPLVHRQRLHGSLAEEFNSGTALSLAGGGVDGVPSSAQVLETIAALRAEVRQVRADQTVLESRVAELELENSSDRLLAEFDRSAWFELSGLLARPWAFHAVAPPQELEDARRAPQGSDKVEQHVMDDEEAARVPDLGELVADASRCDSPPASNIRSPICCVLGHVDTGKTSLLDRIRRTNVQADEAGGITQQIGATFFAKESLEKATHDLRLRQEEPVEMRVPGLLVIDTPGHESFANLRSRGTSLCDISVLVVDIMHGLELQTKESLHLLRERKCPFIVALNKVDRLHEWVPHDNMDIQQSLALQKAHVQSEFDTRTSQIMTEFAEEGFNAALHWNNIDIRRIVSVVPTSAKSGEGISDLLMLKIQLVQRFIEGKLQYNDELACTVLEVKPIQGFGTTIDVVLVNGTLHEGDTIMVCGLSGPIVTQIRALLTPQPMKELRVKGDYVHHKTLRAAIALKISAQDLEEAVPGTPVYAVNPGDDMGKMKKDIMSDADVNKVLSGVDKSGVGVTVQSSTFGALEALLPLLKDSKVPVSSIALGPVHKRHVINSVAMCDRSKKYAAVLAFDVPISKEAAEYAAKNGIPVFEARVIYHLVDAFTRYVANFEAEAIEKNRQIAVFPACIGSFQKIRDKDPITVGCTVMRGQLHVGTPMCIITNGEVISIGRIIDIQDNQKAVKVAKSGKDVTIKIHGADTSIAFGRQFTEMSQLVSAVSRHSINALKESFRKEMQDDDWMFIVQLKRAQGVD